VIAEVPRFPGGAVAKVSEFDPQPVAAQVSTAKAGRSMTEMFCLQNPVPSSGVFFLFAGILTKTLPDAAAVLAAITGLCGGATRYAAVLARQGRDTVERATAVGFFFGLVLGLLALAIDFLT